MPVDLIRVEVLALAVLARASRVEMVHFIRMR